MEISFPVVTIGGFKVWLEDELEGEFELADFLSVLSVFGEIGETNVLDEGSTSGEFLGNDLKGNRFGSWDMVSEVILEEVP